RRDRLRRLVAPRTVRIVSKLTVESRRIVSKLTVESRRIVSKLMVESRRIVSKLTIDRRLGGESRPRRRQRSAVLAVIPEPVVEDCAQPFAVFGKKVQKKGGDLEAGSARVELGAIFLQIVAQGQRRRIPVVGLGAGRGIDDSHDVRVDFGQSVAHPGNVAGEEAAEDRAVALPFPRLAADDSLPEQQARREYVGPAIDRFVRG